MRETYMNGRQDYARYYARSHDSAARLIALLSPYLFWALVGCISRRHHAVVALTGSANSRRMSHFRA